jgi:thioredoxin 1
MSVISINENDFELEVLKSDLPVLLDVYTPYCGPCRTLAPVLDKLATELSDKVKIVKIDAAENHGFAAGHRINSVPTLIAFVKGAEVARRTGFLPEPKLKAWLNEVGLA